MEKNSMYTRWLELQNMSNCYDYNDNSKLIEIIDGMLDLLQEVVVELEKCEKRKKIRRQSNDVCNMSELSRMPCLF